MAAPGLVLAEWPDRLRLEVQDPLGGMLAVLVVDGAKFWWYASDQQEILMGPLERLGEAAGLPFTGKDLVRAFLARPEIERWSSGRMSDAHEAVSGDGKETLAWSDRLNEPLLWTRELPSRRIVVHYEDYANRFGASLPEKVRLESVRGKDREHTISWVWRDWQPVVNNGKKLFQIPQEQHFGRKIKVLP